VRFLSLQLLYDKAAGIGRTSKFALTKLTDMDHSGQLPLLRLIHSGS
jgi:hypothetical protein